MQHINSNNKHVHHYELVVSHPHQHSEMGSIAAIQYHNGNRMGGYHWHPSTCHGITSTYFDRGALHTEHRGKGIGTDMLHHAINHLRGTYGKGHIVHTHIASPEMAHVWNKVFSTTHRMESVAEKL